MKGTMYPEGVRPLTIQDGVVHVNSNGGEGKCRVVLVNTVSEFLSVRSRAGKELVQEMRMFRQRGQLNLTLETAYTKLWITVRRPCEPFRHEMQSMTVRTFNIHGTQRMAVWRFLIWTATLWNVPQVLIVIHDLKELFHLSLLLSLLLLSDIILMLQLILIIINLPLLLLLLLQFSQMSLMLQSLHLS
jgi:hypothetical protein